MTNRKYYKHTVVVEIISENDSIPDNLADIAYQITEGGDSGKWELTKTKTLNGKQAAKELTKQGSDPEFFGLDEKGNCIFDENTD